VLAQAGVRLLVKREDMNHPRVSGNKWWKLKYNLLEAERQKHTTLLTFGGAYSNHIYATAAAAHELGFKSIGVIRGEETRPLNPTLAFAQQCGMHLHYVSRTAYRKKDTGEFIQHLRQLFGEFYLIPEGGTNALAVKGVAEFARTLPTDADYVCCAVGTGGTLAGLIEGTRNKNIIGLAVLKGAHHLEHDVKSLVSTEQSTWQLAYGYDFGGYGKNSDYIKEYKASFRTNYGIPLDFVYTAKAMAGITDLIAKKFVLKDSVILFLHTGGLQGDPS
jgi:1-aminocyclopropane-1-carboxylate deaminase